MARADTLAAFLTKAMVSEKPFERAANRWTVGCSTVLLLSFGSCISAFKYGAPALLVGLALFLLAWFPTKAAMHNYQYDLADDFFEGLTRLICALHTITKYDLDVEIDPRQRSIHAQVVDATCTGEPIAVPEKISSECPSATRKVVRQRSIRIKGELEKGGSLVAALASYVDETKWERLVRDSIDTYINRRHHAAIDILLDLPVAPYREVPIPSDYEARLRDVLAKEQVSLVSAERKGDNIRLSLATKEETQAGKEQDHEQPEFLHAGQTVLRVLRAVGHVIPQLAMRDGIGREPGEPPPPG